MQTWPTSNTFIPFRLYPSMLCSKLAHWHGPAANCTVWHCKVAIFFSDLLPALTSKVGENWPCPLWDQLLCHSDQTITPVACGPLSAIAQCIMPSASNRFRIKILTEPHPRPPLRAPLPSQALSGHPKGNWLPCALVDGANWPCPFQRTPELYNNR